jgi:aryl-alcohol dehydrogenase-like predicted oxidoreductase
MQYRRLGQSGLVVSALGLGCNNFSARVDQELATGIIDACFDTGVNLFDTADYYGDSEVYLGKALKGRRDDAVIATKFGLDLKGRLGEDHGARGSRRYIRRAVEASLRRLDTDHIDLYQQHIPDSRTPIEETLSALTELVREGKVRYIGSSNMTGWQLADADWTARTLHLERFISAQNEHNLLNRRSEDLLPACRRFGVGLLAWYPLANGLLTGKYKRDEPPPTGARITEEAIPWATNQPKQDNVLTGEAFNRVEALERYGEERGLTLLEVAIGGLVAQPGVGAALAGASRPEQVRANAKGASWVPSADDLAALRKVGAGARR